MFWLYTLYTVYTIHCLNDTVYGWNSPRAMLPIGLFNHRAIRYYITVYNDIYISSTILPGNGRHAWLNTHCVGDLARTILLWYSHSISVPLFLAFEWIPVWIYTLRNIEVFKKSKITIFYIELQPWDSIIDYYFND